LKWSGTPVTLRVFPAPKAGGLTFLPRARGNLRPRPDLHRLPRL
jgi:hypothetical protein